MLAHSKGMKYIGELQHHLDAPERRSACRTLLSMSWSNCIPSRDGDIEPGSERRWAMRLLLR